MRDEERSNTCISLIAAVARNRVIGSNNALPWRLPEDLKRFKALTLGHAVIMGRKTHESIGRPLPGRANIVVTRDAKFIAPGCTVVHSPATALTACAGAHDAFVIGGAELYRATIANAERMYLTEIDSDVPGDAFFPEFDAAQWQEISRETVMGASLPFAFVTYKRVGETR